MAPIKHRRRDDRAVAPFSVFDSRLIGREKGPQLDWGHICSDACSPRSFLLLLNLVTSFHRAFSYRAIAVIVRDDAEFRQTRRMSRRYFISFLLISFSRRCWRWNSSPRTPGCDHSSPACIRLDMREAGCDWLEPSEIRLPQCRWHRLLSSLIGWAVPASRGYAEISFLWPRFVREKNEDSRYPHSIFVRYSFDWTIKDIRIQS